MALFLIHVFSNLNYSRFSYSNSKSIRTQTLTIVNLLKKHSFMLKISCDFFKCFFLLEVYDVLLFFASLYGDFLRENPNVGIQLKLHFSGFEKSAAREYFYGCAAARMHFSWGFFSSSMIAARSSMDYFYTPPQKSEVFFYKFWQAFHVVPSWFRSQAYFLLTKLSCSLQKW